MTDTGKTIPPLVREEKTRARDEALTRHLLELAKAGIDAKLERVQGRAPAILGVRKGEPFAIYALFLTDKNNPAAWAMQIRVRYKGQDVNKAPLQVLK